MRSGKSNAPPDGGLKIDRPPPGAIREDLEAAVALLREEPGIGAKVETSRPDLVRRLFFSRVRYFVYYRVRGQHLEVVAFWHSSREQGPSL